MGLREQKKEATRQSLLEKAGRLFEEKGYHKVTTAEIARAAGVAEGTLFNYYRSKGELFIAAMMPGLFTDDRAGFEPVPELAPHALAAAVTAWIDRRIEPLRQVDKRILRDYFSIIYSGGSGEAEEAQGALFAACRLPGSPEGCVSRSDGRLRLGARCKLPVRLRRYAAVAIRLAGSMDLRYADPVHPPTSAFSLGGTCTLPWVIKNNYKQEAASCILYTLVTSLTYGTFICATRARPIGQDRYSLRGAGRHTTRSCL